MVQKVFTNALCNAGSCCELQNDGQMPAYSDDHHQVVGSLRLRAWLWLWLSFKVLSF